MIELEWNTWRVRGRSGPLRRRHQDTRSQYYKLRKSERKQLASSWKWWWRTCCVWRQNGPVRPRCCSRGSHCGYMLHHREQLEGDASDVRHVPGPARVPHASRREATRCESFVFEVTVADTRSASLEVTTWSAPSLLSKSQKSIQLYSLFCAQVGHFELVCTGDIRHKLRYGRNFR